MKITLFLIICTVLVSSLSLQAQELTVKSITVAGNDLSESQYERKDYTGRACAFFAVSIKIIIFAEKCAGVMKNYLGIQDFKTVRETVMEAIINMKCIILFLICSRGLATYSQTISFKFQDGINDISSYHKWTDTL